jgi:hypothetical protein
LHPAQIGINIVNSIPTQYLLNHRLSGPPENGTVAVKKAKIQATNYKQRLAL